MLGPTGLGFIAFDKKIKKYKSNDFWYDYSTHADSKYTLGYNCISALHAISKKHNDYKKKIIFANRFLSKYTFQKSKPLIGCKLIRRLKNKNLTNTLYYQPRTKVNFDVIFFRIIKLNKSEIIKILKKKNSR